MKRPKRYHYRGRKNGKSSKTYLAFAKNSVPGEAPHHHDKHWIDNKIRGHGGAYGWHKGPTSLAHITYIGNKNKLQILWYNIILYWKWLKRKGQK